MNRLAGTIKNIDTEGHLSLVTLEISGGILSCIVIDTPDTCDYLEKGRPVSAIFKETEVAIGKSTRLDISLQNRIQGTIHKLSRGRLLCKVELDSPCGLIKAVITSKAATQLALGVGQEACALIKTNEIMLAG